MLNLKPNLKVDQVVLLVKVVKRTRENVHSAENNINFHLGKV